MLETCRAFRFPPHRHQHKLRTLACEGYTPGFTGAAQPTMKAAIDCKIVARLSLFLGFAIPHKEPKRESNLPLPRPTSLRCAQTTLTCATAFSPALLSPGAAAARVCADQAGKASPDPNCPFCSPRPPPPAPPARGARGPVQRRSKRLCFLPRSAPEPRRTVRQGSFISLRGFSSSCTLWEICGPACLPSVVGTRSAALGRNTVCVGMHSQHDLDMRTSAAEDSEISVSGPAGVLHRISKTPPSRGPLKNPNAYS